ncbi:SGNH/GDSL hydrolase family protein [Pseudarthrobacter sp. S9]|uniref:SGNH/GDSL hydrolase family protein n=1 Tax=Pseudarthrobacter sp. S9 TaxID=3418421 RepID=UPI003CFC7E14
MHVLSATAIAVTALAASVSWSVTAPPRPAVQNSPAQVLVVGDSLSTGHGTSPADAWPNLINESSATDSRPLHLVNAARDGSGYLSPGGDGSVFASQVTAGVAEGTQAVVFFGSENDVGSDPVELHRAAAAAYALAHDKAPNASLIVIGPPAYTNDPEPDLLQVRDVEKAAALKVGATFIDPIAEHWIAGHTEQLLGPDGDHPSLAGQRYLKEQMERLLVCTMRSDSLATCRSAGNRTNAWHLRFSAGRSSTN